MIFHALPAKKAVWWTAMTACAFILVTETLHRIAGSERDRVVPGWTYDEFIRKVDIPRPAHDIIFVGDSRVGWGIADRLVTDDLREGGDHDAEARNLGLAATRLDVILEFVAHNLKTLRTGGVLMLHYSPAGWFWWQNRIEPPRELMFRDSGNRVETTIDALFGEILTARPTDVQADLGNLYQRLLHGPGPPTVYWKSRTVFADGFVNATLAESDGKSIDPAAYELENYRETYRQAPVDIEGQIARLDRITREFRASGWQVVMFRLPLGSQMLALEAGQDERLEPVPLSKELKIPFLDYAADPRTSGLKTQDQSHLTPESARMIAPILAQDILQLSIDGQH